MIKNLLFDLGGVIIDLRRQDCIKAFERLGMSEAANMLGEYSQAGVFGDLESGRIDADQFHAEIRSKIPGEVSDAQIDEAFNRFLVGIPVERLRALEKLRHTYRIYLISNTNPIMWDSRIAEEFRKDGHDINHYFDGMVTSFEAKSMKPDREIFDLVVSRYGIKPSETLFFDDSEANIEAANKLGFRTVLVKPNEDFYKTVALGI